MRSLIFLFGLIALASCTPPRDPKCQSATLEDAKKAERALADFAVNLYKNASADEQHREKNQAISPVSVALALVLLENGADGETRQRLQRQLLERTGTTDEVLKVYRALEQQLKIDEPNTRVEIANVIFHDRQIKLKEEYERSSKQCLDAQVQDADFQQEQQREESRQKINRYISDKTHQKIRELIKRDDLKPATKVVLANAMYLKASWERAFNKQQTTKAPFYRNGREQERQDVQYMKADGQYRHHADEKLQVVELRYERAELAMYVLLPKQKDGLKELERRLNGEELRQILGRLQHEQVQIQLPKFGIRSRTDLKEVLSKMGLENVFGERADLSRMTEEKLKVSQAAHEAYLQIDENGTEAAAAASVVAVNRMAVMKEGTPFIADHPFLYTIVHTRTGAVVFIGKVNEVHETADE